MKTACSDGVCRIFKKKRHMNRETKYKGADDLRENYRGKRFLALWSSLKRNEAVISLVVDTDSPDRLKTIKGHKCHDHVRCT